MKRVHKLSVVLITAVLSSVLFLFPRTGRWNVFLAQGEPERVAESMDWKIVRWVPELRMLTVEGKVTPLLRVPFYSAAGSVTGYAEDIEVKAFDTPNDPFWRDLWGVRKVTEEGKAYDITRGSVAVAVIDTGIDEGHPDLQGARCVWSAFNGPCSDGNGHGTHVAGTVAARWNGLGVVGVCPGCEILGFKALSDQGSGPASAVAAAIVEATKRRAKVINLSLGADTNGRVDPAMASAIRYAVERGVVVVAAAGNSGKPYCAAPANSPGAICVGAVDAALRRAGFSNYGKDLDLVAPGVRILSTFPGGGYRQLSGTSMATPHVTGTAALLYSVFGERKRVESALFRGAVPLGSEREYGKGLVDAWRSLQGTGEPSPSPTPIPTPVPSPTPSPVEPPQGAVEEMLREVNLARSREGLYPLRRDPRLDVAARRHSTDMQRNRFCGHIGSDGSSPYRRMREAGYPSPYGETVACGYLDARSVVKAWLNSPAHRRILLCDRLCTEFGGGVSGTYWTLDFGAEGAVPLPTPSVTPQPTPEPTPGFWLWCSGKPLRCEERVP